MWFRCCVTAPVTLEQQESEELSSNATNEEAVDVVEPEKEPLRSRGLRGALSIKLQVDFSELEFFEQIGKGSFKTVFRGRWGSTKVAIVRMRKGGVVTDARVMQRLSTHPNLVQFYRWAVDGNSNEHIIMELVAMGSLDKLLAQIGAQLRTRVKVEICEQVCSAMCALVKENVLHRDLAARNVLVQTLEPVTIKVSDFGLARDINRSHSVSGNLSSILQCLPIRWVPPEVITRNEWSEKSDIWAYGITMWEIFSNGAEPYANLADEEVVASIRDGLRLPPPPRCPRLLYVLMTECWKADPRQRPTFAQISEIFRNWRKDHQKRVEQQQAARAGRGDGASSPDGEAHMTTMTTDSDLGDLVFREPSQTGLMAMLAAGAKQTLLEGGSERQSSTASTPLAPRHSGSSYPSDSEDPYDTTTSPRLYPIPSSNEMPSPATSPHAPNAPHGTSYAPFVSPHPNSNPHPRSSTPSQPQADPPAPPGHPPSHLRRRSNPYPPTYSDLLQSPVLQDVAQESYHESYERFVSSTSAATPPSLTSPPSTHQDQVRRMSLQYIAQGLPIPPEDTLLHAPLPLTHPPSSRPPPHSPNPVPLVRHSSPTPDPPQNGQTPASPSNGPGLSPKPRPDPCRTPPYATIPFLASARTSIESGRSRKSTDMLPRRPPSGEAPSSSAASSPADPGRGLAPLRTKTREGGQGSDGAGDRKAGRTQRRRSFLHSMAAGLGLAHRESASPPPSPPHAKSPSSPFPGHHPPTNTLLAKVLQQRLQPETKAPDSPGRDSVQSLNDPPMVSELEDENMFQDSPTKSTPTPNTNTYFHVPTAAPHPYPHPPFSSKTVYVSIQDVVRKPDPDPADPARDDTTAGAAEPAAGAASSVAAHSSSESDGTASDGDWDRPPAQYWAAAANAELAQGAARRLSHGPMLGNGGQASRSSFKDIANSLGSTHSSSAGGEVGSPGASALSVLADAHPAAGRAASPGVPHLTPPRSGGGGGGYVAISSLTSKVGAIGGR